MSRFVQIVETSERFLVDAGESILQAGLRAGVQLSYECQFGSCATCRIKILEGAVSYDEFPMALSTSEAEHGYALACQALPQSDLTISTLDGLAVFPDPAMIESTVTGLAKVAPRIYRLSLALQTDSAVKYIPGQYMNIHLPDGLTRSFSMACSAPSDGIVEFHIRQVPGGYFTDHLLSTLQPGQALRVEMPLGRFCFREKDWRPLVMAATGTGIAPIKAILESLLDSDDCPPVSLYWGMRNEGDLYLHDEICAWTDRLCEFSFTPVLSQPRSTWTGRRGYVQHAIAEDFSDLSDYALYLCGSPAMIADAQHLFVKQGAQTSHIYTDSFTFQRHATVSA